MGSERGHWWPKWQPLFWLLSSVLSAIVGLFRLWDHDLSGATDKALMSLMALALCIYTFIHSDCSHAN